MVLVFLCNHSWNVQQGDVAHIVCLFAWLPYPIVPVAVLCEMLRCQMLRIRERQTTQRTKDKNITDGFKAWYIKLLLDDGIEFFFRQEVTVALCLVKADFSERVIGNPFVDQRKPCDFLQVFQAVQSTDLYVKDRSAGSSSDRRSFRHRADNGHPEQSASDESGPDPE